MDAMKFDRLAKSLARSLSRRATLLGLLSGLIVPVLPDDTSAKGKSKRRGRGHDDREQNRLQSEAKNTGRKHKNKKKKQRGASGNGQDTSTTGCCGAKQCADPKPGATRAGCDFSGRDFLGADFHGATLRGINGRGTRFTAANLRGAVFADACLHGASFRRAKLAGTTWGGACLVDANFTDADLGGDSAVFAGALLCGTILPDGTVSNRDCGRETACCQDSTPSGPEPEPEAGATCQKAGDCPSQACQSKACESGQCVYTPIADGPDPNGLCATHCCQGNCCNPGATECNPLWICCAPNCAGKGCGPDGCGAGGTCGTCPPGTTCDGSSGVCVCSAASCPNGCCEAGSSCQPGNTSQSCGADGETCARCTALEECENGACVPIVCTGRCSDDDDCPDLRNCVCNRAQGVCCSRECAGKVCGPDGCGGECDNLCPSGTVCNGNGTACLCTAQSCPNGCCSNGLGNPGTCEPGNTVQFCGKPGQACRTCTGQEICQNEQCVCIPTTCAEQGRTCGSAPDGCGGTLECGTCGGNTPSCTKSGVCASCPEVCGDNGCLNMTNGDTFCCDNIPIDCGLSCSSNANCSAQNPLCLASFTTGANTTPPNQTTTVSTLCQGEAAAVCTSLDQC